MEMGPVVVGQDKLSLRLYGLIEWKKVGDWCPNKLWRPFQRYSHSPSNYLMVPIFLSMPPNITGTFKVQGTWLQ